MDKFEKQRIKNFQNWEKGKKVPPSLVSLRLTSRCDLSCLFCDPNVRIKESDELKIKHYQKLFKELNEMKVGLCAIVGGGEALVKKDLTLEVMKLIKKYKMKGWLVTNGVNFDERMIKEIINMGFDDILFSLDGADAETHDYLRGKKGTFNKVIKNIQKFNYWKKKLKKKKPLIKIQTLITNRNYHQIEEIIRLTKKHKINKFLINFMVIHKKEWKKLELNEEEMKKFTHKLKKLLMSNKIYKKSTNFEEYLKIIKLRNKFRKKFKKEKAKITSTYCFQPWYHLNISETGFVNFCPELDNRYGESSIKEKSIKQIWYGWCYNRFRKKILNCEMLDICAKYCNLPIFIENLKIKEQIKKNGS